MPAPRHPPVQYDPFKLAGGLDLVTPTQSLPPGVARSALNFECSVTGGYTRIAGYEAYDGRPSPNAATIQLVTLTKPASLAIGVTITNQSSSASGAVVAMVGNSIVYTQAVGTFAIGDVVSHGATVLGTVTATLSYPTDTGLLAQYQVTAASVYRQAIGAVGGAACSGPVVGLQSLNGTLYAWRPNAAGTGLTIWKATSSGWVQVTLGWTLAYNTAVSNQPAEGTTIVGGTSGATGVLARAALDSSPTWAGGSGRFVLSATTGTFVNGEALKVGGTQIATCGGIAAPIVLTYNGTNRVETCISNIVGATGSTRIYGADGVNNGFEFDGSVYVPILTGMSPDNPLHVLVNKNVLFLTYGGSVNASVTGSPYCFSAVLGGAELVMPLAVTGMLAMPGNQVTAAAAFFTRNDTYMLYGVAGGGSGWNLVSFDRGTGGNAYTSQTISDGYVLDDKGVVALATTLNYGNFDSSTLTFHLRPFIQSHRGLATAAGINREKSQYRVFYSDGFGLYVTIVNGKAIGSMPVLFPNPVNCWAEADDLSKTGEVSYFGSTNGYVYKMDVGPNFDGLPIAANLLLNFNSVNTPRYLKRYRRASLEVTGSGYAQFAFGYLLGYGTLDIEQPSNQVQGVPFANDNWDSFTWDEFTWDIMSLAPVEIDVEGCAQNIALAINSNSNLCQPFTINSATLNYSLRRGIR